MGIVEEAFSRLFPEAAFTYAANLRYSGRFKPYNATVRKVGSALYFNLSRSWKNTSDEIVVGLVQHLLVKILRKERFPSHLQVTGPSRAGRPLGFFCSARGTGEKKKKKNNP